MYWSWPDPAEVPLELLCALADEAPKEKAPPKSMPTPTSSSSNGPYTSRLMVDKWLSDHSIAYRLKPQRDDKGRFVYVLKECPFDSSHGDPDSCIMQTLDGELSAHCFHNSCKGRGWKQFKEVIGKPESRHYDPPLKQEKTHASQKSAMPSNTTDANEGHVSGKGDAWEGDDPGGGS